MDNEGDELNEWNNANDPKQRENRTLKSKTAYFIPPSFYSHIDKQEIENIKMKQIKAKKCKRILRQVLANCVFMSVMLLNSYLNKSSGTFFYQNHIQNVFESYKDVIKSNYWFKILQPCPTVFHLFVS